MQSDKENVALSSVLASAGLTTMKFLIGVGGSLGTLLARARRHAK